jgi:hypothetical protein
MENACEQRFPTSSSSANGIRFTVMIASDPVPSISLMVGNDIATTRRTD